MEFLQQNLTNPNLRFGRFGTALGKIGDVDLDGYNDLAVSAPFDGDGAVYIYLGGPDGISSELGQRIQAPSPRPPSPFSGFKGQMFGHALSKGVDIDGNEYRDIAIGAPNSEAVYIYKTYPVIKVIASLQASRKKLFVNDTTFEIEVCARYESAMKTNRKISES